MGIGNLVVTQPFPLDASSFTPGVPCSLIATLPLTVTPGHDPEARPRFRMSCKLAVQGRSAREVAIAFKEAGHPTSDNQRNGLFRKESGRVILTTDGNGDGPKPGIMP